MIRSLLSRLRRRPSELDARLADFDRRIAEARRRHQPIRHIEAERTAYMHGLLRAGR